MIIRTYDKEENDIVKVWTPDMLAKVKELRPVGGFDTETLEIDADLAESYGMDVDALEYDTVMYSDNALSICRQSGTGAGQSILCQEHVKDRILYRCFFCHEDEQQKYCKATNSAGRRCAQIANGWFKKEDRWRLKRNDVESYCRWHTREREEAGWKFDLEKMDKWLDGYQKETVMLWKQNLIKELQTRGKIAFYQLMEMREVLGNIKSGKHRASALPTKTNTYFILCDGYVKIGRAKDPDKRFADLCRENDKTIRPKGIDMKNAKLLGWIAGSVHLESDLHGEMYSASKWVTGEWFHYDSEAALLIEMVLGSGKESVEWLLDDLIENYETIISHDVQGGFDFKLTPEYLQGLRESYNLDAIYHREQERKRIYGF
jgi:hypothetical protein